MVVESCPEDDRESLRVQTPVPVSARVLYRNSSQCIQCLEELLPSHYTAGLYRRYGKTWLLENMLMDLEEITKLYGSLQIANNEQI